MTQDLAGRHLVLGLTGGVACYKAAELAREGGVSRNQFIAAAVAEKVGVLRTAAEFIREQAGDARPEDLLRYVRAAPKVPPVPGDELGSR